MWMEIIVYGENNLFFHTYVQYVEGALEIKEKRSLTCEEGPHDTDGQLGHTEGLGQGILGTQVRQQLDCKDLCGNIHS